MKAVAKAKFMKRRSHGQGSISLPKEVFYNIIHNNFVGTLQVRQIQCNVIRVIIFITKKKKNSWIFHNDNNDLETFCNELYLLIHLLVL